MATLQDIQKAAATALYGVGNAQYTGRCRIMGLVLTAGVDAATLSVYDAATAAGTSVIVAKAAINTTTHLDFGPNGVRFSTAISSGETGTAPDTVIYYIPE